MIEKPGRVSLLSQWLNGLKLFGIPYLVGKIKFKLFFQGPLGKWDGEQKKMQETKGNKTSKKTWLDDAFRLRFGLDYAYQQGFLLLAILCDPFGMVKSVTLSKGWFRFHQHILGNRCLTYRSFELYSSNLTRIHMSNEKRAKATWLFRDIVYRGWNTAQ